MASKLSIVNVKVLDSSNIDVTFSSTLAVNLVKSNIVITSDTINVPDSDVLLIKVSGATLSITCQPLTPLAAYYLNFRSIPLHPFQSLNGDERLPQDGVSNKYFITAPLEPNNPIKNYLGAFFKDNIYNTDDDNALVNKYIESLAIVMARALYDIRQVKNENYLSFTVTDERKVRGAGPFDRLDEECAYEVSRVGRTPNGTAANNTFPYTSFPYYPVTLQKQQAVEILDPNTLDDPGFFDVNNLTLNLGNSPVTKIISVTFTLNTSNPVYVYDISKLGYQIKDSRYDQEYGFSYLQLDNNQVRLSDKVIEDPLFELTKIIKVDVIYEYKNLGVVVNLDSVLVYSTETSPREVLPPIINIFNLSHAPIIDGSNNIPVMGGISFEDPNSNTGAFHPAFKFEIPFRFDALPSAPGQYAVDYLNGTVYVYGNDLNNDGTGPFPPLATYKYRLTYQSDIDYTYDNDLRDIVALPTGSLVDNPGKIAFSYEEVLVPGVDYEAKLHSEELVERINNNLVAFNVLKTQHTPITNVFRVYNETSGEIYTINRWSDDKIYFRFNTPPKVNSKVSERVTFRTVSNDMLFVHSELSSTTLAPPARIFKIFLNSNRVVSSSEDGIAAFQNTSLSLSNSNIFQQEIYYNPEISEEDNMNRFSNEGLYMIDYSNGLIYVSVSDSQDLNIGTATYKISEIVPDFPHLIAVDDIYYQVSPLNAKNKNFSYTSFGDGVIVPEVLEAVNERFLNGYEAAPYQVYNKSVGTFSANNFVSGVTNQIKMVRGLYEYHDYSNSIVPFNFAQSSTSNGFNVTVNSYQKQFFDTVKYDGSNYYIDVNENIPTFSPNISYTFTVTRVSDNLPLWDNNNLGSVTSGNPIRLTLSGFNTPTTGDQVNVVYSFTINDLSRVIVDYNRGDYFVDYTYLADEIIVSYEYGDNVLDFRRNSNLPADTNYFVTYKVGALRDALLKNFGTLVNIPELANFDIDFDRERYRDALMAALTSFIQGPTVGAIKNIGKTISHIEPQVIENAFINWSLGSSLLVPEDIITKGEFESEPVKHGSGLVIDKLGQSISFPVNSNIRFEEGTFETWIKPKWNGLDNDAQITITVLKDGSPIPENEIFIGSTEYHPKLNMGIFTIGKNDNVLGEPNSNKDGIYIYYDKDISGAFDRWYVRVIDGYTDGLSNTFVGFGLYGDFDSNIVSSGNPYFDFSAVAEVGNTIDIDGYTYTIIDIQDNTLTLDSNLPSAISDEDFEIYGSNAATSSSYKITIKSNGTFYDSKLLTQPVPSNVVTFTGTNSYALSITGGNFRIDETATFISDVNHYLLDFGKDKNQSRLSIFKDVSGYMNFRVIDKYKQVFTVSADISNWKFSDIHHIAASWKLNTFTGRDEMHLFLDGFEVPNIIKYGQKLQPYLHEKFRTVDPEEIVGLSNRDIVGSVDLVSTIGSNIVSSSLNFSTYQISAGDTIFIDEPGFSTTGYTINSVIGQSLLLNVSMPLSITNGRFSINRTQYTITSEIDIASNISVATISSFLSGIVNGSSGTSTVTSTTNFATANVLPGYLIRIDNASLPIVYTILQVSGTSLTINGTLPVNISSTAFTIYSNEEKEIPGVRAIRPSYSISKDTNFNNILSISNNVFADDLILIRTLGLNFRKIKKSYYVWSDGQENILMTQLPPPIALDEAKITKIILNRTAIGASNSTLTSGTYVSNNLPAYTTSTSQNGRTLSVTISGNNVDFTTPTQVTINGVVGINTVSETINFSDYGTLDSVNQFTSVNYIQVNSTPINSSRNAVVIEVKEKYSITHSESSDLAPIVRFSYHIGGGSGLYNDSPFSVTDDSFLFSTAAVGNYLVIHQPISVAGYYKINDISDDKKSLFIQSTLQSTSQPLPDFTGGVYQILNVNDYRSGLQNGYFTFEDSLLPAQAYFLLHGLYELEYSTYTAIRLDPINSKAYLGSDYLGANTINAAVDQLKIYSTMLTDTRIGEAIPENQRSITKDFNSLKALKSDINTLMLVSFDIFPPINSAKFYSNTNTDKAHFQSAEVINKNFGNSIVITNKPIIVANEGVLNTKREGSIEFWVNPLFDSANDPSDRFYFDAYGAQLEESVSVNQTAVKISSPASKILSVHVKSGDSRVDYFAGGRLEIDTQHAVQEEGTSTGTTQVVVSKPILQVISVKAVNDKTGNDYFQNGSIGTDRVTIYLGKPLAAASQPLVITYQTTENKNVTLNTQIIRLNKKLPSQNTEVIVKYIPQGLQGDRISIYKDKVGYLNFGISASGTDFVVRAPTRWSRNTWHRVKASYKINGELGSDEMRLFIDGYQYQNVVFGNNILYNKFPNTFDSTNPGGFTSIADGYTFVQSIKFKDPINELYIGTQYTEENPILAMLDNFRISTISRPIYAPYGEPIDVNYSSNLSTVFPVTEDLFTTYLMNFNKLIELTDNFTVIKNRKTGLFDFSVNILDSFGIVNNSLKVQEVLEKLIKVLKPANSRVFIQYIR